MSGLYCAHMADRTTEVWARNPHDYIRELTEVGMVNVAWDYGILRKRNIDPKRFLDLYFGRTARWRALLIGEQGTIEVGPDNDQDNPVGEYQTWEYGQDITLLEDMMLHNKGKGEHRVVVIRPPAGNSGIGREFYRTLSSMQEENPDCILHVHGLYSYRLMFAPWYRSVDVEPRILARNGKVYLPTGKEVRFERTFEEPHWVTLLGFRPHDLRIPRNRCMFNLKSAMWAAEHFKDAVKIRTSGFVNVDPDDPFKKIQTSKSIMVKRIRPRETDKILCNLCSLQIACKYFREGAVCIVPDSEPLELARFFKSRNSDDIIDGLGTLLAAEARRLDKALETEEVDQKLMPETTKIINTLFDRGRKLAMLVNPTLASNHAAKLTVNATQINAGTPQQLMAAIVNEFVARGIPRESITPAMVMKVFESPEDLKNNAIEAAVSEKTA